MADASTTRLSALLVGDGELPAGSVASGLESAGDLDVTVARDPEGAIDRVDAADGVLVGEGVEDLADLVRRFRERAPETPLFLLATDAEAETISAAVEAGVVDYFPAFGDVEPYGLVAERLRDVAERRHAERTYREIIENVADGLVIHDPGTGEILDVNERFCEMNGYEREDLVGRDVDVITAEEYAYDRARELIDRAGEEGPQLFEWRNERKDGTEFPVEVHLGVVHIDGEERVLASVRDITERKRREREYEEIFNSVRDAITVHDPETGEILEVNERLCELTGYDAAEIRDLGSGGLAAESEGYTGERAAEIRRRVMDGETIEPYEWAIEAANGDTIPIEANPTRAVVGGEERFLVIARDITERKRREREYEQIFDGVNDAVAVFDPETGEILDVNERYHELLGYDDLERIRELGIEGLSVTEEGYTGERGRTLIREVAETGEPETVEWRGRREDGKELWLEATLAPAEIGGEQRVLSIQRDITERKRRQQEYEQIFDGVNDVISVHDPATGEMIDANETLCELTGYEKETLLEIGVEGISPDVEGHSAERSYAVFRQVAESGQPELIDGLIETRDGEHVWIEANVTTGVIGGEKRVLSIGRDVTDRRHREETVRRLHDATERIQDADTEAAVAERAVDAARDVLDLPMTACWLERDARLEPAAMTDPVAAVDPPPFEPGDVEYEAFREGQPFVYDPSEYFPENPLDCAVMLPLGEHGLLAVGKAGVERYEDFLIDAGRTLAGHVRAALDRVERAAELRESERRFRMIAERVEQVIYLASEDLSEVLYANPAYETVYGRPVDELYEDARAFIDAVHEEDVAGYREDLEAMLADIEARNPRDSYDFEYRVRRPDGEVRWLEATGYPILDEEGDPYRFVGIAEDVTAERERERTLETFHEATTGLTRADSPEDAAERAIEAAEGILEFPHAAVYRFEEDAGELVPVAASTALEEGVDSLPVFGPGESLPWEAFVEGDAVRRSKVDRSIEVYGEGVPDPELLVPLGSHGVLLLGGPEATFEEERVELVQILAATVEAALNHVEGERELREREAELREQRARADRLDRLNAVIRGIEQATVEEPTREAIERAVCDRLIDAGPYETAWIGAPPPGEDGIAVHAAAGDADLEGTVLGEGESPTPHPAFGAIETGEVRAVQRLATETANRGWQRRLLRAGQQSVVAVPLVHEDRTEGVLVVASEDPTAFEDRERRVLAELGRSVGYEMGVLERQRALDSDATTELEFDVEDEGLLVVELSREGECRVELERTIRRGDGTFSAFYSVEGVAPEELAERLRRSGAVGSVDLISREGDAGLIEATREAWFGTVFTERGGVVRTAVATEGSGRVVAELPGGADTREVVEAFREAYPEVELRAKRERERDVQTALELRDTLAERLTRRQLEALETAYSAGYFEWPRGASGEEIADLLDIAQPTFNKHLRAAERKAFGLLLDRETAE